MGGLPNVDSEYLTNYFSKYGKASYRSSHFHVKIVHTYIDLQNLKQVKAVISISQTSNQIATME